MTSSKFLKMFLYCKKCSYINIRNKNILFLKKCSYIQPWKMATQEEMSRYFWSASTNCPPVQNKQSGEWVARARSRQGDFVARLQVASQSWSSFSCLEQVGNLLTLTKNSAARHVARHASQRGT